MAMLAVAVILSLDVDQGCDLRVRVGDGVADGCGAWLAGMVSEAGSLPESGTFGITTLIVTNQAHDSIQCAITPVPISPLMVLQRAPGSPASRS
jgi:hypothetical protein